MGSGGGCVGWTVTNNNECYLKTSVGDMRSDSGVQGSGYCYPSCGDEQANQNNDGHNYAGPFQVQNREFCKAKCQASRGQCKGWTVTNDGECFCPALPSRPQRSGDGQQRPAAVQNACRADSARAPRSSKFGHHAEIS